MTPVCAGLYTLLLNDCAALTNWYAPSLSHDEALKMPSSPVVRLGEGTILGIRYWSLLSPMPKGPPLALSRFTEEEDVLLAKLLDELPPKSLCLPVLGTDASILLLEEEVQPPVLSPPIETELHILQ